MATSQESTMHTDSSLHDAHDSANSTSADSLPHVDLAGLTSDQAQQLISEGKGNTTANKASHSYWTIVRANIFTLFNGIMFTCLIAVLLTGQWQDGAFSVIAIINTAIGTIAEIHAKRLLDRLTILVSSKPIVRRDGQNHPVDARLLVPGDLVWLRSGEQVPADMRVVDTWGAEVDESMLTGESRSVAKKAGDSVFSGSTMIAGLAFARVMATGTQAYAARLTAQAKVYKKVHSDLQDGINTILKGLVWVVVPLSIILLVSQIQLEMKTASGSWQSAVISTVAGVVSLIPQGLVLLTSVNFALSGIRLARKKVLVQQLNSIETLARVDCLNLDKTGTITDGGIVLDSIVPLDPLAHDDGADLRVSPADRTDLADIIPGLQLAFSEASPNATGRAVLTGIADRQKSGEYPSQDAAHKLSEAARITFSSQRKWSGVLDQQGTAWIVGAPQFVLAGVKPESANAAASDHMREQIESATQAGKRVLVLATVFSLKADAFRALADGLSNLPEGVFVTPVALVLCSESIRPQAASTLAYFRDQGVRCRIVSGDDPRTVAAIARKVDLCGDHRAPRWMDARDLKTDPVGVSEQIRDIDVLGRVLPEQKKLIVEAQHLLGHTVGMTGDGVNDTLAIKEADFGIAMGNAAPATKSVADAVLLDSDFSHLPDVVGQGRRVMTNMERVASLFLVKTFYSVIITLGTVLFAMRFPYLPRQMSYISPLCIGIPAFILSLPPNNRRYKPGFLGRVLRFSLPAGCAIGVSTITFSKVLPWLAGWDPKNISADLTSLRTCVAMVLFVLSLLVLAQVSRPLPSWRGILVLIMAGIGIGGAFIPPVHRFFKIIIPDDVLMRWILLMIASSILVFFIFEWLFDKLLRALWRHGVRNQLRLRWWGRRDRRRQLKRQNQSKQDPQSGSQGESDLK